MAARSAGRLLDSPRVASTCVRFTPFETIFAQGDRCTSVMYIERGRVRLSVISRKGKTAVVAMLHAGEFFGEGALAGQRRRRSTAETMAGSTITIVETADMRRRLHEDVALSDWFRAHMLAKNIRIEKGLATDQLFNSSRKRLARALMRLAHFDERRLPRYALPAVSRSALARMSGTTRPRVAALMNDFQKLGFIECDNEPHGGLQVHRSMLNIVLQD